MGVSWGDYRDTYKSQHEEKVRFTNEITKHSTKNTTFALVRAGELTSDELYINWAVQSAKDPNRDEDSVERFKKAASHLYLLMAIEHDDGPAVNYASVLGEAPGWWEDLYNLDGRHGGGRYYPVSSLTIDTVYVKPIFIFEEDGQFPVEEWSDDAIKNYKSWNRMPNYDKQMVFIGKFARINHQKIWTIGEKYIIEYSSGKLKIE